MCRYGNTLYKPSFVCFSCRKSFKKVGFQDYLSQHPVDRNALKRLSPRPVAGRSASELQDSRREHDALRAEIYARYEREVSVCPQCAGTMHDLGLDFKAPRQSDRAAWKAVEGALRMGHQFHTCGCDGPGFVPASAAEYRRYLSERLEHFQDRRDNPRSTLNDDQRISETSFWAELVDRVEAELAAVARR